MRLTKNVLPVWRLLALALFPYALCVAPIAAEPFEATKAEIDAWVAADRNEDGALTPDEFPSFIDRMAEAGQSTAATVRFFDAYGTAFAIADANGDGRLTPNELRSADDDFREENDR